MSIIQRIVKNIAVGGLASVIGNGLFFVTTVLIARALGASDFGKFSLIFAIVSIFQLIANPGLTEMMVREIALDREKLSQQLNLTRTLLWFLGITTSMVIILFSQFSADPEFKYALIIMALGFVFTVQATCYSAVMWAMEEMEYQAIGFISHKCLLLFLVIIVVHWGYRLIAISVVFLLANLFLLCINHVIVSRRYFRPRFVVDLPVFFQALKEAYPIGISTIVRIVSWQVDILILSAVSSTTAVGLFSAANKVIKAANMLPRVSSLPLFPEYSRRAKGSRVHLFALFNKTLTLIFIIGVPAVLTVMYLSEEIIFLLFGQSFAGAAPVLQVMSLTILFLFPTSQFTYIFTALEKQSKFTIFSLFFLVLNILFDVFFIPVIGIMGAALGTLLAEMGLFVCGLWYLRHDTKDCITFRGLIKPLVAGSFMVPLLWLFPTDDGSVMILRCFAAVFVYLITIVQLKTLSREEVNRLRDCIPHFGRSNHEQ